MSQQPPIQRSGDKRGIHHRAVSRRKDIIRRPRSSHHMVNHNRPNNHYMERSRNTLPSNTSSNMRHRRRAIMARHRNSAVRASSAASVLAVLSLSEWRLLP